MGSRRNRAQQLGTELLEYCERYFIDPNAIIDILYDQKVVPMIRGKGMEYNAYAAIKSILNEREWVVNKLNLAAQPGAPDQDISILHRRSGILITVESKSAVRGSFRCENRRARIKEAHFKVKCHRSRSNKQLATNDRYEASSFDIIVTNPLNGVYKGKSIGVDFEFVDGIKCLQTFYGVSTPEEAEQRAAVDWMVVRSKDIAEEIEGKYYLPRTPYVLLQNDPNWKRLDSLEELLLKIVKEKKRRK